MLKLRLRATSAPYREECLRQSGLVHGELPSSDLLAPKKAEDGTWVMSRNNSAECKMPLIDAVGDNGKFVDAILADPEKYVGKTLCAAEKFYTLQEIVEEMSKSTGEEVVYKQIEVGEFRKGLRFGGDIFVDIFADYFGSMEEFGYYGAGGEEAGCLG